MTSKNVCKEIVSVDNRGRTTICGLPGVEAQGAIRCPKHWNSHRNMVRKLDKRAKAL